MKKKPKKQNPIKTAIIRRLKDSMEKPRMILTTGGKDAYYNLALNAAITIVREEFKSGRDCLKYFDSKEYKSRKKAIQEYKKAPKIRYHDGSVGPIPDFMLKQFGNSTET